MQKAIVIGAGVAGLASSIRLAKAGYDVTVIEANEFVGGKINSKRFGNYRFDMGPSVFTGPEYLKELYTLCGEDFSDFKYQRLNESFTYFYPDGTSFTLNADRENQVETLSTILGETKSSIHKYLDKSKKNYELIAPLFIEKSLHKYRKLFGKALFKALLNLRSYKLGKTMHQENASFFKNPKTIQLFDRFATYNGSDPYQAPAMLNMIAHLELNKGVYLPENGMIQIPNSLKALALKQGVKFRFGEKVTEILVENKAIKGVTTTQGEYPAHVVFSNMDIYFTYKELLKKELEIPEKILSQEKSSSAFVFYFGIKKNFKNLGVHNVFFAKDYKAEFNSIFLKKELYTDPTIYLNITSKSVKNDAPEQGENWFVMINAPVSDKKEKENEIKAIRKILLNKLSAQLNCNVEELIECEDLMTPNSIASKYFGKSGSIYGNASNNKFSAFYRHANFHKKIKGLYFVGVTVHPGGGIPLALNSAKIASEILAADCK